VESKGGGHIDAGANYRVIQIVEIDVKYSGFVFDHEQMCLAVIRRRHCGRPYLP
jgi:hypothetical protein